MKPIETKEEMQIIRDVEDGKFVPLEGQEMEDMKNRLVNAAKNTKHKAVRKKPIHMRTDEDVVENIKAIAK